MHVASHLDNYYVRRSCISFSLIIQNPCPDASTYFPPLPYSEATLDHALLPLPPYSTAKYPQIRPDPTVSYYYIRMYTCMYLRTMYSGLLYNSFLNFTFFFHEEIFLYVQILCHKLHPLCVFHAFT